MPGPAKANSEQIYENSRNPEEFSLPARRVGLACRYPSSRAGHVRPGRLFPRPPRGAC